MWWVDISFREPSPVLEHIPPPPRVLILSTEASSINLTWDSLAYISILTNQGFYFTDLLQLMLGHPLGVGSYSNFISALCWARMWNYTINGSNIPTYRLHSGTWWISNLYFIVLCAIVRAPECIYVSHQLAGWFGASHFFSFSMLKRYLSFMCQGLISSVGTLWEIQYKTLRKTLFMIRENTPFGIEIATLNNNSWKQCKSQTSESKKKF